MRMKTTERFMRRICPWPTIVRRVQSVGRGCNLARCLFDVLTEQNTSMLPLPYCNMRTHLHQDPVAEGSLSLLLQAALYYHHTSSVGRASARMPLLGSRSRDIQAIRFYLIYTFQPFSKSYRRIFRSAHSFTSVPEYTFNRLQRELRHCLPTWRVSPANCWVM